MKICTAHWLFIAFLVALGSFHLMVSGCGQKGPLTLPDNNASASSESQ